MKERLVRTLTKIKDGLVKAWTHLKEITARVVDQLVENFIQLSEEDPAKALGVAGSVIVSVLWLGTRVFEQGSRNAKRRDEKKEEYTRRCRVYDPHTRFYIYLKRPLTCEEQIELQHRSANGETYAEILRDMRLTA